MICLAAGQIKSQRLRVGEYLAQSFWTGIVHDNRLTVEGDNRNRKFLDGCLRLSECPHEDISTDDILDAFVPFFVLFIDRGVTYTNLDFFLKP
jgi:hypothetical protein